MKNAPKTLILLEDDPQQWASIKRILESNLHGITVEVLETESDFRTRLKVLKKSTPNVLLVISDVMLPWSHPASDAPKVPKEVASGTFRKAGMRCWSQFRTHPAFQHVPWIYFTVLDEDTIEFGKYSDTRTRYAQKTSTIRPLLDEISELIGDSWSTSPAEETQRIRSRPDIASSLLVGLRLSMDRCRELSR